MKKTIKKRTLLAIALTAAVIFPGTANAQNVSVGNPVAASQQVSIDSIDHKTWDQLLQHFVNEKGQVNYKAWKESANGTQALDSYLASLSSANPQQQANRENQLAFWINAYNALTVKGILREYPTTSIRNHTSETGGYNLWKNLFLPVGSSHYSLDNIEHKILRKMNEPRIHFAIVCASHSCPRLLNKAYVGANLENQLATNTQVFFGNPENFQYDQRSGSFRLSEIIQWFGSDFGADQGAQLRYLSNYLPTQEARAAAQQGSGGVSFLGYSWALNEQPPEMAKQGSGMKQGGSAMKQGGSAMKSNGSGQK